MINEGNRLIKNKIITQTEQFVKMKLCNDTTGHDWEHIQRVRQMAVKIAEIEDGDSWICEMASLLHDTIDDKLTTDVVRAEKEVIEFMKASEVRNDDALHILEIMTSISFKGGKGGQVQTLEGRIVQDADRLDAIGAIGIARAFTYAGAKGQPIYDPSLGVRENMTLLEYRNGRSSAIHHFYEKLLKLKDRMNTAYGHEIAEERHRRMEGYLQAFYSEWNGRS